MKEFKFSDDGDESYDSSQIVPEQFIVTTEELDHEVYDHFLTYVQGINTPYDYPTLLKKSQLLSGNTMPTSQKQMILAQLARQGTAEAYRLLQHYAVRPDSALEQWGRIAMYECQMRLESDLLDEPVGLISTGLGGDGERLRYIFVLAFQGEAPAEGQQEEIREGLDKVCQEHRSVVEQAQFRPACLYVQVLVPMDVAVGAVIEESLVRLNRRDEFFRQEYLVTNVSVPTDEEIQEFLGGLPETLI